jgi:hypothetical protein
MCSTTYQSMEFNWPVRTSSAWRTIDIAPPTPVQTHLIYSPLIDWPCIQSDVLYLQSNIPSAAASPRCIIFQSLPIMVPAARAFSLLVFFPQVLLYRWLQYSLTITPSGRPSAASSLPLLQRSRPIFKLNPWHIQTGFWISQFASFLRRGPRSDRATRKQHQTITRILRR